MSEPTSIEFRAMGGPCRVVVEPGARALAESVCDLVRELERRWSRFRSDSEISGVNRSAGRVVVVSQPTLQLVGAAVRAVETTRGLFNPLMLRQLEAAGYRRPWNEARPRPTGQPAEPGTDRSITLYPEISAVRIPRGCGFDPGGIGKGLAVDLAIERCRVGGSAFASVELGGDLRVYGSPWYGDRWEIGVADPFEPGRRIATLTPTSGAVTTSSTLRRRWTEDDRTMHHLLDPGTGAPSRSDLVAVTTCADLAWWAEVSAKSALLAGSAGAIDHLRRLGVPGAAVTVGGEVLTTADGAERADRDGDGIEGRRR